MEKTAEIIAKIDAQKKYAGDWNFAPDDGICWGCHKQIYERISIEKASSELITGCPWCNKTYVD